ncbi:UNVERIFIED_CONTAM: hypothetical protein FKN15_026223 [Acipenser sinensis]
MGRRRQQQQQQQQKQLAEPPAPRREGAEYYPSSEEMMEWVMDPAWNWEDIPIVVDLLWGDGDHWECRDQHHYPANPAVVVINYLAADMGLPQQVGFQVGGATLTCTFVGLEKDYLPLPPPPPWDDCLLLSPPLLEGDCMLHPLPSTGEEVELPLPPYWLGAPTTPLGDAYMTLPGGCLFAIAGGCPCDTARRGMPWRSFAADRGFSGVGGASLGAVSFSADSTATGSIAAASITSAGGATFPLTALPLGCYGRKQPYDLWAP